MAKTYAIWLEIEEYDTKTEKHRQVTKEGEAEPVKMGTFATPDEAVDAAEEMDNHYGDCT